jgi:hypothetical protein
MAKRKRKCPAAAWFTFKSDQSLLWEEIRWPEDDLMAFCAQHGDELGLFATRELPKLGRSVQAKLAREDWPHADPFKLVGIALNGEAIREGIGACLPTSAGNPPDPIRAILYFARLMILGGQLAAEGSIPDRQWLLHRALLNVLAVPAVEEEIEHRAQRHGVGLYVLAIHTQAWFRQHGVAAILPGPSEKDAVAALGKLAWKKIPRGTLRLIAAAEQSASGDGLLRAIDRQAVETVLAELVGVALPEAIARWLAGKLDGFPTAITRDCIDYSRRLLRQQASAADVEEITFRLEEAHETQPKRAEVNVLLRASLASFLEAHPEHADGVALQFSDKPLRQLAAEQRPPVSVQTIINRRKRTDRALETWVQAQEAGTGGEGSRPV